MRINKNNKTYCRGARERASERRFIVVVWLSHSTAHHTHTHSLCNFSCALLLSGAQSPDWCTTCKHQFSSLLFLRARETFHTHFVCMWERLSFARLNACIFYCFTVNTHSPLLCVWKSIVSGAFPFVYIARFSGHKTLEKSSGAEEPHTQPFLLPLHLTLWHSATD
jgi:hypothetical protein